MNQNNEGEDMDSTSLKTQGGIPPSDIKNKFEDQMTVNMEPQGLKTEVDVDSWKTESEMSREYTHENLLKAVSAVKDDGLKILTASKRYGIPFGTLWRRVKGKVDVNRVKRGPQTALSEEAELDMKQTILELQRNGFDVTKKEIMDLAAKTDAEQENPAFSSGKPSNRWFQRFMQRHHLSLRTENLSTSRLSVSSPDMKNEFFNSFSNLLQNTNVTGNEIFNMGEIGFQLSEKTRKIAAQKGKKCVYKIKSRERSENVTVVACANATATVLLSPMVIFKGENLNEDLTDIGPLGTIFACSPRGYMVTELFFDWLTKFITLIPPKRPALLLLDGHLTNITRETLILAKENQIHLLCLPANSTQFLQPLDFAVFKYLKEHFKDFSDKKLTQNRKPSLNKQDFSAIFKTAWLASFTPANIIGGFEGSGIWPLNKDRVPEQMLGHCISGCEAGTSGAMGQQT